MKKVHWVENILEASPDCTRQVFALKDTKMEEVRMQNVHTYIIFSSTPAFGVCLGRSKTVSFHFVAICQCGLVQICEDGVWDV